MRHGAALICAALLAGGCASDSGRVQPQSAQDGYSSPAEVNAELGLGYLRQGDLERALGKLRKALEQDPELADAHHYIAELYKRLGEMDLAAEHFAEAVALAPGDAALRNNYGVFLCGRGDYEAAAKHFAAAADNPLYRRRAEALENAGLCLAREPAPERAEEYLREALAIDPRRPQALYRLAVLNYEQGEYLSARAHLQRFEGVARHGAQSLWLGVRIERELGDERAAAAYARRLRGDFPDSDAARALRADGE